MWPESTKESRVWDFHWLWFSQPTGHFLAIFNVKMGSNVCEYSPNATKVHIRMHAYIHIMIIVKLFIKHKILFGKTCTYRPPPPHTHSFHQVAYCTDLVTCFSVAALAAHLTVMCGLFDRRRKAALTASVKICNDGQHPKARLADVAIFGFLLHFHFHQAACLQTLS